MHSRRSFLRSIASTIALPMLEPLYAASIKGQANPLRLAYIYLPNGVNVDKWFPQGSGKNFQLSSSLAPLAPLRDELQIIRGLTLDHARANGDGAGDHARANATFLTGCRPKKTAGADIRLGISVDQIAAQHIGNQTRLPSLELSTDEARRSGNCDSGYSCAYQYNLAWRSETTPAPPIRDPRSVFEALFGTSTTDGANAQRIARKKSVLDFVREDASRLQARSTGADRNKLDEYFTAVREIEQRIQRAEKHRRAVPEIDVPNGVPDSYAEHIRTMYDMMHLAFQTDSTRVATFLLAHDGSNRTFPEVGINEAHHNLSHHQHDKRKLEMIAKIDTFYAAEFARFLQKMKSTSENHQSLLDSSMIVFGGGICDGDKHNHENLPIILAGGGSNLQRGRILKTREETPLTNLHLSLLERMGVPAERIGDSTGKLDI
jgi:Protein of unknown function (DUF1552)